MIAERDFERMKALTGGDTIAAALLLIADRLQQPQSRGDAPQSGLLDVRAVAEQLGVSAWTVRALVSCGKLPVSKIGRGRGTLRFDPADVKTYQRESAGNPLPASRHAV